jgi:hypothetical protein
MIGNYGVPPNTKDEHGMPKFFESEKVHITALIVAEYSEEFSHWNAAKSLGQWLHEAGKYAQFHQCYLIGIIIYLLLNINRNSGSFRPGYPITDQKNQGIRSHFREN